MQIRNFIQNVVFITFLLIKIGEIKNKNKK